MFSEQTDRYEKAFSPIIGAILMASKIGKKLYFIFYLNKKIQELEMKYLYLLNAK